MKLLSAVFCLTKISYQEPLQEPLQVPRQVLLEDDCSMSAYSEDDYSGTVWHTNFEDCWGICGAKGGACNVEGCDGFCCSKSKIDLNGDCPASAIQFLLTTQHSPAHTCVVPEVNQHGFNQRKHGYYDDPLVTGGHEPQPHSYPFVAMMLYHEGFLDHPERKCGGSILNENWILTSAQCCKDLPENERISFRIGAHRDEDCDFKFCANKISEYGRYSGANDIGTGIYVKNKLIHPDFKQVYEKCYPHKLRALQNDFCLIETKTTMKFGRHVQKISIADEDFFTEGKQCFALGWGNSESGERSKFLRKSRTERTRWRKDAMNFLHCGGVDNNSFCMDYKDSHSRNCDGEVTIGDSGSPLFCKKGRQNILVGVTSYGYPSCPSPTGVYADVRRVNSWINKNISKRTSEKCFIGFRISTKYGIIGRSKSYAVNSECDCAEKCRKDSKCRAFTFVTGRRNICRIKTQQYRRAKSAGEKNIISGIKLKM